MGTLNIKNVPEELHERLRARAKRQHRSVAQEVIHLLATSLDQPEPLSILDLKGLGREVWKGIDPVSHVREERATWD